MNAKETVNCGARRRRRRAVSAPSVYGKTYISAFGYTAGKGGAFMRYRVDMTVNPHASPVPTKSSGVSAACRA